MERVKTRTKLRTVWRTDFSALSYSRTADLGAGEGLLKGGERDRVVQDAFPEDERVEHAIDFHGLEHADDAHGVGGGNERTVGEGYDKGEGLSVRGEDTVAIPMKPANQMKKVVKRMETRVPKMAIRLMVPKCLKKGY